MSVKAGGQTPDSLLNLYGHPRPGRIGRGLAALANSRTLARFRRGLFSRLPFPRLESNVTNVVYTTWLLDTTTVSHLVPPGLTLWERNGQTPFTILTYQHGHFGPSCSGPLRRLLGSPLQSNWRLYLQAPPSQAPQVSTVLFLKNTMNSLFYVLGTRLFSDVLATHLPETFVHRQTDGRYETVIFPGSGSAPALNCVCTPATHGTLGPAFSEVFDSWASAVEFLCLQDGAVSYTDQDAHLAFSEIDLPIDLTTVQPLGLASGELQCPFLDQFSPAAETLCYLVPEVLFQATSERLI